MRSLDCLLTFVLCAALCAGQTSGRKPPPRPPVPPPTSTVTSDDAKAHDAVAAFLRGIKISDLPEGRKLLADTQWIVGEADRGENFYSRPQYTNANSLYSGTFETDVPHVLGYKELFEVNGVTEAGSTRSLKLLVIAFKDASSGTWKVLGSLDNVDDDSGLDIDRQVSFFRGSLDDTRFTSAQTNYFSYGHWLLLDGRIREAKAALELARTSSTTTSLDAFTHKSGGDPIRAMQINALLEAIAKIAPGPTN